MASALRRLYWARYRARQRGIEPPTLPPRVAPLPSKATRANNRLYGQRHRAKQRGEIPPPLPPRPTSLRTDQQLERHRISQQRVRAKRRGLPLPAYPPLPERGSPIGTRTSTKAKGWFKAQRDLLGEKRCGHCKKVQRLKQFWRSRHTKDGYNNQCKVCSSAKASQWRRQHRDNDVAKSAQRRARKHRSPLNDLTAKQWEEIKLAYGYRCVYCQRKMQRLTQDHLTPLSQGGMHTVSNVVPACKSCNSKKGKFAVLCPVQPLLLTIAAPAA